MLRFDCLQRDDHWKICGRRDDARSCQVRNTTIQPLNTSNHVYSFSKPAIIRLEDDEPEAVLSLCRILHYQSHKVIGALGVEEIFAHVATGDKYDCAVAIAPGAAQCYGPLLQSARAAPLE